MWLIHTIARNSLVAPTAGRGRVRGGNGSEVAAAGEHKNLSLCGPYGVVGVPPAGESAVVLPLDDGEVCLGVPADTAGLAEGEVMLRSRGGASIVLKNDGRVLINGREVGND